MIMAIAGAHPKKQKFQHFNFCKIAGKEVRIKKKQYSILYYTNNILSTDIRCDIVGTGKIKMYYNRVTTTGGPFYITGKLIVTYQ